VLAVAPFALALALVVPRLLRGLNGLVLGEAEAFHLGIDVDRMKRAVIVATAAATGAAVAVSGIVGFVGIIVPHLVRLLAGPERELCSSYHPRTTQRLRRIDPNAFRRGWGQPGYPQGHGDRSNSIL
jgi:ABC-type cobalamin transport system permease subunit